MIRITQGYRLDDPIDAAMFEDRRRLFCDLMRWDVPIVADRFEIDQFDNGDATYLVDLCDDDLHRGSLRLLPSTGAHILGDLFPVLADRVVPRGDDICEITRLCLPTRLGASRRLEVRNRLISTMVDHALASGIRTLTGVVRPGFLTSVLAMGWDAQPLGSTREIGGMALGAFRIEIDTDTPARLISTGIYTPQTAATVAVAA